MAAARTEDADMLGWEMTLPRIVIIGAGFAGYHAAKSLQKSAGKAAEIVLINPTDYFLYLPLLPEVAAGLLEPRRICVSLPRQLPKVRLVLGTVDDIDLDNQRVGWVDPEGARGVLSFDRLILASGSVNKLLPIPGLAAHAHGFRGIPEALYLRDHITRQIELAAETTDTLERDSRCTFVVVGAGYTGTELTAQGQLFTERLARQRPQLRDQRIRWMILDTAPRLLPELDPRLSKTANRVLHKREVGVRVGQTITEATSTGVILTTKEEVLTHSLIWCVGVRPEPLVDLPTEKGRLTVDEYLTVAGHPNVFACGDCAAVPDLTRPGELTGMTAQHAQRQGTLVARNVVASLASSSGGSARAYKHHDLGFLVDLGGTAAAANPLGVPLSGIVAKAVTRSYHLLALPGNRIRTAVDWALNVVLRPQAVQLGLVRSDAVPLDTVRPDSSVQLPAPGPSVRA
jgi:NADH dehydrogenase